MAQQYVANVHMKTDKVDWPAGTLELRLQLNDGTIYSTSALPTAGAHALQRSR